MKPTMRISSVYTSTAIHSSRLKDTAPKDKKEAAVEGLAAEWMSRLGPIDGDDWVGLVDDTLSLEDLIATERVASAKSKTKHAKKQAVKQAAHARQRERTIVRGVNNEVDDIMRMLED